MVIPSTRVADDRPEGSCRRIDRDRRQRGTDIDRRRPGRDRIEPVEGTVGVGDPHGAEANREAVRLGADRDGSVRSVGRRFDQLDGVRDRIDGR